ncbi:hypothetical protein B0H17DRAFT_1232324, partial [Mycena rosella]
TWHPAKADLSDDLKRMMKVGEKYNLHTEGIAISREIQREMPIWYHNKSSATRALFNLGPEVQCLKKNHLVRLVGDAERLARRRNAPRHRAQRNCRCDACAATRRECRPRRCQNPHLCYARAYEMMASLQHKWNPPTQRATKEPGEDPEMVEFNPDVTTQGTLTNVFCIFTEPEDNPDPSAAAPDTRLTPDEDAETSRAYTDGSVSNNGAGNARAGAGIFYGEDDERNRSIKVPDEWGPSNQVGEVLA